MNLPRLHSEYNRALDRLIDHRLGAHGFTDPAEFVPDGCVECFRLEKHANTLEKMHLDKLKLTAPRLRGLIFVAVHRAVMLGSEMIAQAKSHTFARRIANALNMYEANQKGY